MAAAAGGCLNLWRAENDGLAGRWLRSPRRVSRPAARQSQRAFLQLLQKIQGLPAVFPALPLELTVLCNSLLFDIGLSSESGERLLARIDHGFSRVLEACAVPGQGLSTEDRCQEVLQQEIPEELQGPLHQLVALQGLLWLAANRLGAVEGLFQRLCRVQSSCSGDKSSLLSMLQGWHPPDMGESGPLVVQSARDLKDILWTSTAFLQGFEKLRADNHLAALAFLHAAAKGRCSKQILAQIFTLMGCCNLKMGKPQTATQCLKRALQLDSSFLPALSQAVLLYRHLGLVEAELEALALLYQALDSPAQMASESLNPHSLVRTELICTPQLCASFGHRSPSEVKYLLAQRCLQTGRAGEAAEHYLDLLALWHDGPLDQGFLCHEESLPRIPEVFLEAASALVEVARHHDAIAVCEEVVAQTSRLIPKRLQIDVGSSAQEDSLRGPPPTSQTQHERESLRCVLWRAMACLLQGCAWAKLREAKKAISHLSRCLHDLLIIQFVNTGGSSSSVEENMALFAPAEAQTLPWIRQLALTARGVAFLELERDKEALMDFQHSLHFCPESSAAHLYLLHTLWRLGRKQEASAHWQKFHTEPALTEEEAQRSCPQYLRLCMKWMKFPHTDTLAMNLETGLEGGVGRNPRAAV